MVHSNRKIPTSLAQAVEAIDRLTRQGLTDIFLGGQSAASFAYTEIGVQPVSRKKRAVFYRHFPPLVSELVAVFVENYRRYFKLALVHPDQTGSDPDLWAWSQLQPALDATFDWIRDWFVLACDGENRYVRRVGSIEFVPGQTVSLSVPLTVPPASPSESWRAPAWLFQIGSPVGVGPLKEHHVPATESEEKLSAAHTRLLLKGARRAFLMTLGPAIENVRNEETAAAGTIPAETLRAQTPGQNKRTGWQQKQKLYNAIQKVLGGNPLLQGMKFCAELDKRHAPPLYDWTKRGEWRNELTWKEAWSDPGLRRKIRRVRQEAMKNL
jgi:hypothetical protein